MIGEGEAFTRELDCTLTANAKAYRSAPVVRVGIERLTPWYDDSTQNGGPCCQWHSQWQWRRVPQCISVLKGKRMFPLYCHRPMSNSLTRRAIPPRNATTNDKQREGAEELDRKNSVKRLICKAMKSQQCHGPSQSFVLAMLTCRGEWVTIFGRPSSVYRETSSAILVLFRLPFQMFRFANNSVSGRAHRG